MRTQRSSSFLVLLTIGIGTFMAALDSSVTNIAMPVIRDAFGATLSQTEWVITAYLLVVSSTLLTFGRVSDLYGQKRLYLTGMLVFTVSSLLCGISGPIGIGMLIACRAAQAVGASMMLSCGNAIVTGAVPPEKRGRALSITAVAVATALSTGPVLGGILVSAFGWSSIFLINVPVGIIASLLVAKNIASDQKKSSVPFDPAGSVLIFAALMLVLLPLEASSDAGLSPVLRYVMLGAGLGCVAAFILHERKCAHPLLNISLFKSRVFAASNAAAALNYMAQYIMIFLAPFYLEKLRLFTPAQAGLLYIPMPLVTMAVAPVSGVLSDRFNSRVLSTTGMGILTVGLFMLSRLNVGTPLVYIIASMVVAGIGVGLFQTPNNSAIMGSVTAQYWGTASGTLATMRNIGMVFGVALSGLMFSFYSDKGAALYAARGLSGAQLEQTAFVYALHLTFTVAVIVALLAMVASFAKKGEGKPAGEGTDPGEPQTQYPH